MSNVEREFVKNALWIAKYVQAIQFAWDVKTVMFSKKMEINASLMIVKIFRLISMQILYKEYVYLVLKDIRNAS